MKGKKGCKSKGGVLAAAHAKSKGGGVGASSKPGHIATGSCNTSGATVSSPLSKGKGK